MTSMQSIEAHMRHARWMDAQRLCREALFSQPTNAKLHAFEGICFFRLGDFAAAESCFMRATALEPSFVDAGVKRCQCLERLRKFDEALELAHEWRAKRPHDPVLNTLIRTHGHRPNPRRTEGWEAGLRRNRAVEFAA